MSIIIIYNIILNSWPDGSIYIYIYIYIYMVLRQIFYNIVTAYLITLHGQNLHKHIYMFIQFTLSLVIAQTFGWFGLLFGKNPQAVA